jgi:hypothetical protein
MDSAFRLSVLIFLMGSGNPFREKARGTVAGLDFLEFDPFVPAFPAGILAARFKWAFSTHMQQLRRLAGDRVQAVDFF